MDSTFSALRAGAGIVIITLERIRVEHSFRLGFRAFNNEVEYAALIAGLKAVLNIGAFTRILGWWLIRCKVALKLRIPGQRSTYDW